MITIFYHGAKGGVTYQNAEFYEISHHNLFHKVTLSMPNSPIFDILMKILEIFFV